MSGTGLSWPGLDLLFTDSLIRLGYHERFGKLNPHTLDPQWNLRREEIEVDAGDAVLKAISSASLLAHLKTQFPRGTIYQQLRKGLARYRQIMAQGGWPEFPEGPTLRPGARDERVTVLAQRLVASGDLPQDGLATIDIVYDESIEAGVRHFQLRHGRDVDGIIGPATVRALNVPVEDRVRQLRINLERARWVFDDTSDDFILVNIAGFAAYVIRDGWTQKGFQDVLDSGEIKTVFLAEPLPVLLLYWTAEVREDDSVYFYQDIYDRDQSVADGLDARFILDRPARN